MSDQGELSASSRPRITARMEVLEVIHRHRSTEAVFKAYEAETGACLCCEALFDTLEEAARGHGLDLARLLRELNRSIGADRGPRESGSGP